MFELRFYILLIIPQQTVYSSNVDKEGYLTSESIQRLLHASNTRFPSLEISVGEWRQFWTNQDRYVVRLAEKLNITVPEISRALGAILTDVIEMKHEKSSQTAAGPSEQRLQLRNLKDTFFRL